MKREQLATLQWGGHQSNTRRSPRGAEVRVHVRQKCRGPHGKPLAPLTPSLEEEGGALPLRQRHESVAKKKGVGEGGYLWGCADDVKQAGFPSRGRQGDPKRGYRLLIRAGVCIVDDGRFLEGSWSDADCVRQNSGHTSGLLAV